MAHSKPRKTQVEGANGFQVQNVVSCLFFPSSHFIFPRTATHPLFNVHELFRLLDVVTYTGKLFVRSSGFYTIPCVVVLKYICHLECCMFFCVSGCKRPSKNCSISPISIMKMNEKGRTQYMKGTLCST